MPSRRNQRASQSSMRYAAEARYTMYYLYTNYLAQAVTSAGEATAAWEFYGERQGFISGITTTSCRIPCDAVMLGRCSVLLFRQSGNPLPGASGMPSCVLNVHQVRPTQQGADAVVAHQASWFVGSTRRVDNPAYATGCGFRRLRPGGSRQDGNAGRPRKLADGKAAGLPNAPAPSEYMWICSTHFRPGL
jgi:hypothetical protein